MREIKITHNEENQRLDKFLLKYLNEAPKSFIYKMLRKKNIKLNGAKAEGKELLINGDILNLYLAEDTIEKFSSIRELKANKKINVVYEDDNILVVNKETNLLSQPDTKDSDSIIDRILVYLKERGEYDNSSVSSFTPAICNRLDRNTTGLIICAKNLPTLQELNRIFREREEIEKYYIAVVKGSVIKSGVLEGYHLKDTLTNKVSISKHEVYGSSYVKTLYEPIKTTDKYSIIKIQLVTGKSHQIRSHLKSIGHPVLGDAKYGDRIFNKAFNESSQLLHAQILKFNTNSKLKYLNQLELVAKLPANFNKYV